MLRSPKNIPKIGSLHPDGNDRTKDQNITQRTNFSPNPTIFNHMKNPFKQGHLTGNSKGIGTVTRKMVLARAHELAVINGRSSHAALESDFAQAQRELTGGPEIDPRTAVLEAAPETERWDPLPGSTGHKVAVTASADEDDEGRSDNERLVEEGVAEAEHDQMLQAGKSGSRESTDKI
jgi:hypothetical protein